MTIDYSQDKGTWGKTGVMNLTLEGKSAAAGAVMPAGWGTRACPSEDLDLEDNG